MSRSIRNNRNRRSNEENEGIVRPAPGANFWVNAIDHRDLPWAGTRQPRREGCVRATYQAVAELLGIDPDMVNSIIVDPSTRTMSIYHRDENRTLYNISDGAEVPREDIGPIGRDNIQAVRRAREERNNNDDV